MPNVSLYMVRNLLFIPPAQTTGGLIGAHDETEHVCGTVHVPSRTGAIGLSERCLPVHIQKPLEVLNDVLGQHVFVMLFR